MKDRLLAALLVVHDDLERQLRAARPFRIRQLRAIPDQVTWIVSSEGGFAPLPTGGPGLRPGLALPPPRSGCAGGPGARTRRLRGSAPQSGPVPAAPGASRATR